MNLERADFASHTWDRLEAHLSARLQELREQNDKDSDEKETAKRRGRIAEVKTLLGLRKEALAAGESVGDEPTDS